MANNENTEEAVALGIDGEEVLRLGAMMMAAGAPAYRVIRAMKRAARALGFTQLDAIVSVSSLVVTIHRGGYFRTIVYKHDSPGIDSSRIEACEHLTHNLPAQITSNELRSRLDDIENHVAKRWPKWLLCFAASFSCGSFALLNGFGFVVAAFVLVAAFAGRAVATEFNHHHVRALGGIMGGATAACLSYWALQAIFHSAGLVDDPHLAAGFVASALFLIPGFPLFTSMIDLSRADIEAGTARFTWAVVQIVTATFALAVVSSLTGLNPENVTPDLHDLNFAIIAVASFVGIAGSAFGFNSSKRMAMAAACVGTVGNVLKFLLMHFGTTIYPAALVGGLVTGLLGGVVAKRLHIPRITTTVPGAVIMVPGAAMVRTMAGINRGDMTMVVNNLTSSSVTVVAIGAGLVLASMLSDRDRGPSHHVALEAPKTAA